MRGIRTSILSLFFSVPALLAAPPDYLPLQNGNSWLYLPGPVASGVSGTETVGALTYSVINLLGREYRLRRADDNTVFQYHPDTQKEDVFLAFGAEENQSFATSIDPCVSSARIVSTAEKFSGPLGDFDTVLHVAFTPSCADAGLTDAWFLPYIGLIRYHTETIAGPRTFDLTYSKTGIVEVSTGLLTTKASLSLPVSDNLQVRLAVANSTAAPVTLQFSDGKRYDLLIKNEKGDVVGQWSLGIAFIQTPGTVIVTPGGEQSWGILMPLNDLPPGRYSAHAWVAAANAAPQAFSASVGFELPAPAPVP
jgi:hypothetical protein